MPKFLKGIESEEQWMRAKKIVKDQYGDIEDSNSEKFYALTMQIYKSLCMKHKCSPKGESVTNDILSILESAKVKQDEIDEAVNIFGAESAIEKGLERARAMIEIFKKEPYLNKEKNKMKSRFEQLYKEMGDILKGLSQ